MGQEFSYFCYRCGRENRLNLPMPNAPDYHHTNLACKNCGDGTHILVSHCPKCSRYVYWINDMSIPSLVEGFARYMVHNMQALIDKAAMQGSSISIDTPHVYPIQATCPCGEKITVNLPIPDMD